MRVWSSGVLSVCLLLAACGGQPWCEPEAAGTAADGGIGAGGGGGGGDGRPIGGGDPGGETVVLRAPVLTVAVSGIKTFRFDWGAVAGALSYRLLEDLDGPAGAQPARVVAELPADQVSHSREVFLPDRIQARYQLLACRGEVCEASAAQGIDDIDRAIGFFKASQVAALDHFGASLAVSADGQLFAVGVPGENGGNAGIGSTFTEHVGENDVRIGAVYVFRRGDSGWVRDAYIKPEPAQTRGRFGAAVALAGGPQGYTLLVGAPEDRSGGQGVNADPAASPAVLNSGAAYVFERAADGAWTQRSFIKAQGPLEAAAFGSAVSLSQDRQWAAVGQPHSPGGGLVHLYESAPGGWTLRRVVQGNNTETDDAFGAALQLDARGETLVVGAAGEDGAAASTLPDSALDDDSAEAAGAVYVFRRGTGDWLQSAYLKAAQREEANAFGSSLALSPAGDLLVVGEPGAVVAGGPAWGKAHVFSLVGSSWQRDLDFASPLNLPEGAFGARVALATDAEGATIAVADTDDNTAGTGLTGAPTADGQTVRSGSVFVYRRQGAGAWSAPVAVKAPNNQSQLAFGSALALSAHRGTLAVFGLDGSGLTGIGATPNTDQDFEQAGAVYLY